jgi:hypothetical protein
VYRFVFDDDNAGAITGAKVRDEPDVAQKMLERYNKADDFSGKQVAGDALATAIVASKTALSGVELTEKAENDAGDDEILARLEVRKALQKAYGMLLAAFPGKKTFVESFFTRRERSAPAAAKVEGGETSTIGAAAAPAAPAATTGAKPA